MTSSYPSPPPSASPRKSPTHGQVSLDSQQRQRRRSSLAERYPGDMSHRPLDQLAREKAIADKARHVTKKHTIRPDQIDELDGAAAGGAYHHGGPYDATLFARNNSYNSSPVAAVADSNNEALKATPKEKIMDSLDAHRPLDGVAAYAPGEMDRNGTVYNYEKGENMMIDNNPAGGAYKRWPGIDYHPDDIKGKGEPSYSIEKALKDHQHDGDKRSSLGGEAMEMTSRSRTGSASGYRAEAFDEGSKVSRSDSLSKRLSGGLKKRIGSIKRRSHHEE